MSLKQKIKTEVCSVQGKLFKNILQITYMTHMRANTQKSSSDFI